MVALNPDYAPSKTLTRPENRVGDFFWQGGHCVGKNRLASRIVTRGKSGCGYKTASGRTFWLSRDPIAENGGLNLYAYVGNDPINWVDPLGLSRDTYVPDFDNHGGAHVDRYRNGKNIGRYRPDGSPMEHMGKTPSKIPKSDLKKFDKAAAKCKQRAARLKDAARHTTGDEALQVIAIMEGASAASSSDSSSASSESSASSSESGGGTIQFRGQTYRSEGGNLIPVN